jgi:hypothetical protein
VSKEAKVSLRSGGFRIVPSKNWLSAPRVSQGPGSACRLLGGFMRHRGETVAQDDRGA